MTNSSPRAVVRRVNHAVLWVSDARRSADFYSAALGLEIVVNNDDRAIFMRAAGTDNDHDLGLFSSPGSPVPERSLGLYHLAWQVDTLAELETMREQLAELGALVGQSNHGVSKSLYAKDPDGIEFEVMWQVPAELLDDRDNVSVAPLDLAGDVERFGAATPTRAV